MNNKIKILIYIIIVALGVFILPAVTAQQANEYRAFVYDEKVSPYLYHNDTHSSMVLEITYVPIYPSPTYTLTAGEVVTLVDLSQPTSIQTQIVKAIKEDGESKGYAVTRIYVPSYDMKIP